MAEGPSAEVVLTGGRVAWLGLTSSDFAASCWAKACLKDISGCLELSEGGLWVDELGGLLSATGGFNAALDSWLVPALGCCWDWPAVAVCAGACG